MHDIFVSYSHHDQDWVKNDLLPKLEARGFSVMVDFRDFATGSFSVDEMQRGVEQSTRVIAVLTEDYLQSQWGKLENVMAQTTDPAAAQRKLIPVLIKNCTTLPLRLRILSYRDLRTGDPDNWERLFRDVA